ncbi:MAG: hypothetical protein Q8O42_15980 [Acidobacteriota bacterium]|nr:hypothetical protein [Acidobacteriota bacterium]
MLQWLGPWLRLAAGVSGPVAVHDRGLAAAILRDFESDLAKSMTMNAVTWQDQRSFTSKIQEGFWFYFSEIL